MDKKKIVFLTGAGISAESGIATFRGADGLWEGHRIEEVATPEAFKANPSLVLEFYNLRRKNCIDAEPNRAHEIIAELEEKFDVWVVTQNVDDLHERGGASNVLHVHGELMRNRSSVNPTLIFESNGEPISLGDKAPDGSQVRPHIVWFGEAVPLLDDAQVLVQQADIVVIVGTSMVVYPAAALIHAARNDAQIFVIDPVIPPIQEDHRTTFIQEKATAGMAELKRRLTSL
ncbi:MAG: NAD-dependent deacylase [Flavobacteriales bacterium]|nr:NAD-dependent deacylase [Flavobacteriales bacterium]